MKNPAIFLIVLSSLALNGCVGYHGHDPRWEDKEGSKHRQEMERERYKNEQEMRKESRKHYEEMEREYQKKRGGA